MLENKHSNSLALHNMSYIQACTTCLSNIREYLKNLKALPAVSTQIHQQTTTHRCIMHGYCMHSCGFVLNVIMFIYKCVYYYNITSSTLRSNKNGWVDQSWYQSRVGIHEFDFKLKNKRTFSNPNLSNPK